MDSDSESEDLLLDDQGVFDDFTVASSWERLISDIEASCRKWQTGYNNKYLEAGADAVDGYQKLRKVHVEIAHGGKNYQLEFFFEVERSDSVDGWRQENHPLQLWFGVQDFMIIAPISLNGVILDASEAMLMLSAVAIALSNCGSTWSAFVPIHDPTRKGYKGIQGMKGPYCRSFESDRLGSQVPVKLMHLEGLYDLFITKLAFTLPDSAAEYDGKVRLAMRLTYRTVMPGFENVEAENAESPSVKPMENYESDTSAKVQWDDEYPWAEWYSVDDPIKGFELIATWSSRVVESGLYMAEFENVSTYEADKWTLAPIMAQDLVDSDHDEKVSFAARLRNLVIGFSLSKEAKFMEDFSSGDSPVVQKITSPTNIPPPTVVDRVLKDIFHEGAPSGADDHPYHEKFQDIKGAPVGSLFAQFCLHSLWFGNCNIRAIAILWIDFVREVRWYWEELQPLPRMFQEDVPNFSYCLVHQKLQLLSACIKRKAAEQQRHGSKSIYMSDVLNLSKHDNDDDDDDDDIDPELCDPRNDNGSTEEPLMLLKSQEKMRSPVTQEPPIMTEDMLLEREQAMARLSVSPSGKMTRARLETEMLSADMAAFKFANPAAIFEDFIRWHSPKDWIEEDDFLDSFDTLAPSSPNADSTTRWPPKGKLSNRMSTPDNTWIQLWNSVKPLPASKQKLIFDHTGEGEKVIHYLETLQPCQLLAQMMCTAFACVADSLYRTQIGNKPRTLKVEIDQLYQTIISILKPLRDIKLSENNFADNMDEWCGDIIDLCSLLEKAEKHVIVAASLYQKIPYTPRLFSAFFSNYFDLDKKRTASSEGTLRQTVSMSERDLVAQLFPPLGLEQTLKKSLRMGNFLNGHEPFIREIIFYHYDKYSEGRTERYSMDQDNNWENILSHRMYIHGTSNDLHLAFSVVSND